jgi:hypothetical protein
MNKTDIKNKKGFWKENKSTILGLTAFFTAYVLLVWIGSLGFYW